MANDSNIIVPTVSSCRIVQNGTNVVMLFDKGVHIELPYQAALQMGRILLQQGKMAEAEAQVHQIVADQAVLMRSGANLGLSDNPRVLQEAFHVAQHDRDLRRYLPGAGGIKSAESVGVPSIVAHPPKPTQSDEKPYKLH